MIQLSAKPKTGKRVPISGQRQETATPPAVQGSEPILDRFIRDPDVMAETETLLSGRTRDVHLKGKLAEAFRQRTWRQTAKIIRSWMLWVILLDLMMLFLSLLLLPRELAMAMLVPAALIVPAALLVIFSWWERRSELVLATTLIGGMLVILLSVAAMGMGGDGVLFERYLHIMLFVAITGVVIFSIPFTQTVVIAASAMAIYLAFQLGIADAELTTTLSGFIFFASGIGATVLARRTMNILAQKSFLLELRDRRHLAELSQSNRRLERLSKIDGLTGAANRHYMRERMEALSREDREVALLMCDIDDFKPLNDQLGHMEGDRCLVEVARIIMDRTRTEADCVARFGGEEFLVLLPDADEEAALTVAERIREAVAAAGLPNPGSRVASTVTLSVGVAAGSTREAGHALEELQLRADTALYAAKRTGRNRVRLWTKGHESPGRFSKVA
jgi:diguanylate cyclase (GGDEF)-like protein